MLKNVIRYLGLALVIVGIVLVMKNLFANSSNNWSSDNNNNSSNSKVYYEANIKLLDKETSEYVIGADLVLKDNNDKVIDEWKTTDSAHKVIKLEKGTYILEQKSTVDGYEANDTSLVFKITGEDKSIVMYNKAKVDEVKESASEVGVDNTLSTKSTLSIVVAISILLVGIKMVLFPNNRLVIKER